MDCWARRAFLPQSPSGKEPAMRYPDGSIRDRGNGRWQAGFCYCEPGKNGKLLRKYVARNFEASGVEHKEETEGFGAHRIADALSQACSDKLTPPVRADIEIVEHGGASVVVASIDEIPPRDEPCYVTAKGMYKGSFIRSFDGVGSESHIQGQKRHAALDTCRFACPRNVPAEVLSTSDRDVCRIPRK